MRRDGSRNGGRVDAGRSLEVETALVNIGTRSRLYHTCCRVFVIEDLRIGYWL